MSSAPAALAAIARARPVALAAWASGLLFLLAGAAILPQVGLSWDEPLEHEKAGLALDYFTSLGEDRALLRHGDARWYGTLFNLVAAVAERIVPGVAWYRVWHVLTLLCGAAGVAAAARLAGALGGARAAWLAAILLATTPRWFGHALFNPKDVPFAALFALATLALADLAARLPRAPLASWVRLGALVGLASAVRLGGLVLLGVAALAAAAVWLRGRVSPAPGADRSPRGRRLLLGGAAASATAAAALWPFWPLLHSRPWTHLLELLAIQQAFPWPNRVLYFGEWSLPRDVAASYLPVWLAIGLPLGLLGGALLTPWARPRGGSTDEAGAWRWRALTIAAAVLLPAALVVARRVPLYDGLRQVLFLLPPLAALAAVGWLGLFDRLRRRPARLAAALVLAVAILEPAAWIVRARGLAYVYFQPLAGGPARASWLFDADYWGLALRALAPELDRLSAGRSAGDPLRVRMTYPLELRQLIDPFLIHPRRIRWLEEPARLSDVEVEVLVGRWYPVPVHPPGRLLHQVRLVPGQRPLALLFRPPSPPEARGEEIFASGFEGDSTSGWARGTETP